MSRRCRIDGCARASKARGLCVSHDWRVTKHGDPHAGRTPRGAPRAWMDSLLTQEPTDDCVPWPFQSNGLYGKLTIDGKTVGAHHVILTASGRPRPIIDGRPAEALHSCDNPPCVNPQHLRWGTPAENGADKVSRSRQARGTRNGWAKLDPARVQIIRELHAAGVSFRRIGMQVGVSRTCAFDVIAGHTWSHVPAPADWQAV